MPRGPDEQERERGEDDDPDDPENRARPKGDEPLLGGHAARISDRPDVSPTCRLEILRRVSLRGQPVEQVARLPGGTDVVVRVGVPEDPYIAKRELDTVSVDLLRDGRVLATVNTVLRTEQESEARALAREIASGLESGALQPTAAAIEPLADELR